MFLKRKQVLPPDGSTYSTVSPNTVCLVRLSIHPAQRKSKLMKKKMNNLGTKCFLSFLIPSSSSKVNVK